MIILEENREILTQEMIEILEEIQINSYNLNQQFIKLNEEILFSEVTSDAAIKVNHIEKISESNLIITMLLIAILAFEIIKLRGDKRA